MGLNEKCDDIFNDLKNRIDFLSSHINTGDIAVISKTTLIDMIFKQNQYITDLLFLNDKLSNEIYNLKHRMNLSNYIIHTQVYNSEIEEFEDIEMYLSDFIDKYTSEGDPFWNITQETQ